MNRFRIHSLAWLAGRWVVIALGVVLALNALLWILLPQDKIQTELKRLVLEEVIRRSDWDVKTERVIAFLSWDGFHVILPGVVLSDEHSTERIGVRQLVGKVSLWPLLLGESPDVYQLKINGANIHLNQSSWDVLEAALQHNPDEPEPELPVSLARIQVVLTQCTVRLEPLKGVLARPLQWVIQDATLTHPNHPDKQPRVVLIAAVYDTLQQMDKASQKPVNPMARIHLVIKRLPIRFQFQSTQVLESLWVQANIHQLQLNPLSQWVSGNASVWPIDPKVKHDLQHLKGEGQLDMLRLGHQPARRAKRAAKVFLETHAQQPWTLHLGDRSLNSGPLTQSFRYAYHPENPHQPTWAELVLESTHHHLHLEASHRQHKDTPWKVHVKALDTQLEHIPDWFFSSIPFPVGLRHPNGHLHGEGMVLLPENIESVNVPEFKGVLKADHLALEARPAYQALKPGAQKMGLTSLSVNSHGFQQAMDIRLDSGYWGEGTLSLDGQLLLAKHQWEKLHLQADHLPLALLGWLPVQSLQQQHDITPWQVSGSVSMDATISKQSQQKTPQAKGQVTLHPSQILANHQTVMSWPEQTFLLTGHHLQLDARAELFRFPIRVSGPIDWEHQTLDLSGQIPKVVWDADTREAVRDVQAVTSLGELPEFLKEVSGEGRVEFSVNGPFDQPVFSGHTQFQSFFRASDDEWPVNGDVEWGVDGIRVPNIHIGLGDGRVDVSGQMGYPETLIEGKARLTDVPLSKILAFMQAIQPKDSPSPLDVIQSLEGAANGEVLLHQAIETRAPSVSGSINASDVVVHVRDVSTPLQLDPVQLAFSSTGLARLQPSRIRWGPIEGCLDGQLDMTNLHPQYQWDMETKPIPLTSWKTETRFYEELSRLVQFPFPSPQPQDSVSGYVSIYTTGNQNQAEADVTLTQVSIEPGGDQTSVSSSKRQSNAGSWAVNDANGTLSLSGQLSHHPFNTIHIASDGLSAQLQHGPLAHIDLKGYWNIPKRYGEMVLEGGLYANMANALSVQQIADTTQLGSSLATIRLDTALNEQGQAHFKDSAIHLTEMGTVMLSGDINGVMTPAPQLNARLWTPESLNLSPLTAHIIYPLLPLHSALRHEPLMNRPNKGMLAIDMRVVDTPDTDRVIEGGVTLDNVAIPLLNLRQLDGRVRFDGMAGLIELERIQLPGMDFAFKGNIQDVLEMPWSLENVSIKGPLFAVPAWQKYVTEVIEGRLVGGILLPFFGPTNTDELPLQFHQGDIAFDEVIYDNIILENVTGQMMLGSSGYFELTNTKARVASGDVLANIAIQPFNNDFIRADITAQHVKANALAQTLLDAPNQIFGDLDGTIRFTTEGRTHEEQMKNVNGTASFNITNGRLPSIAKLETVLTAANILRGGVVGLNLNNLFRVMAPFNTNYFAELSGNLTMNQGVAYTNDILSDGENLDLLIQGSSNLYDGDSDLVLYGDMSQNVNGRLGNLGRFSLQSLLKHIPGIGYVPGFKNRSGLIQYLPGVGYVPGLGGPVDDKSRFEVKLQGSLVDPRSIQDFNWVH